MQVLFFTFQCSPLTTSLYVWKNTFPSACWAAHHITWPRVIEPLCVPQCLLSLSTVSVCSVVVELSFGPALFVFSCRRCAEMSPQVRCHRALRCPRLISAALAKMEPDQEAWRLRRRGRKRGQKRRVGNELLNGLKRWATCLTSGPAHGDVKGPNRAF